MNVLLFNICERLPQIKMIPSLSPPEAAFAATVAGIYQTFNRAVFKESASLLFDLDGSIAINPLSYVPPQAENGGKEMLRIYPASLLKCVTNMQKSWYRIQRNTGQITYSPNNGKLTKMDALVWCAAHELRHKIQKTRQIFNLDYQETRRGFLGVSLDVLKLHFKGHFEHYNQSGDDNVPYEFDSEVIGMYIANLWRSKSLAEISQMLTAEPT